MPMPMRTTVASATCHQKRRRSRGSIGAGISRVDGGQNSESSLMTDPLEARRLPRVEDPVVMHLAAQEPELALVVLERFDPGTKLDVLVACRLELAVEAPDLAAVPVADLGLIVD